MLEVGIVATLLRAERKPEIIISLFFLKDTEKAETNN
jgi:hypothetical protein